MHDPYMFRESAFLKQIADHISEKVKQEVDQAVKQLQLTSADVVANRMQCLQLATQFALAAHYDPIVMASQFEEYVLKGKEQSNG